MNSDRIESEPQPGPSNANASPQPVGTSQPRATANPWNFLMLNAIRTYATANGIPNANEGPRDELISALQARGATPLNIILGSPPDYQTGPGSTELLARSLLRRRVDYPHQSPNESIEMYLRRLDTAFKHDGTPNFTRVNCLIGHSQPKVAEAAQLLYDQGFEDYNIIAEKLKARFGLSPFEHFTRFQQFRPASDELFSQFGPRLRDEYLRYLALPPNEVGLHETAITRALIGQLLSITTGGLHAQLHARATADRSLTWDECLTIADEYRRTHPAPPKLAASPAPQSPANRPPKTTASGVTKYYCDNHQRTYRSNVSGKREDRAVTAVLCSIPTPTDDSLTIIITIKNKRVTALIDTGATKSFMATDVAEEVGLSPHPTQARISAAVLHVSTTVSHAVSTVFTLGSAAYEATFLLLSNAHYPVILGLDTLKNLPFCVTLDGQRVFSGFQQIKPINEAPTAPIGEGITFVEVRHEQTAQNRRGQYIKQANKRKLPPFHAGQMVTLRPRLKTTERHAAHRRFLPKRYGPFKVLRYQGKGTYVIATKNGPQLANAWELQKYSFPTAPPETCPEKIRPAPNTSFSPPQNEEDRPRFRLGYETDDNSDHQHDPHGPAEPDEHQSDAESATHQSDSHVAHGAQAPQGNYSSPGHGTNHAVRNRTDQRLPSPNQMRPSPVSSEELLLPESVVEPPSPQPQPDITAARSAAGSSSPHRQPLYCISMIVLFIIAVKRLMKEAQELREPTEDYYTQPMEDNLFEWHFTVRGPRDTEFDVGLYHGRILLPPEYPMKPPSIILLTPNGRFELHKKVCLSISGHHPESWQPSWSIRTALLAIIGFMPTAGEGAIGSLDYSPEERKKLAKKSLEWSCPTCGGIKDALLPRLPHSKTDPSPTGARSKHSRVACPTETEREISEIVSRMTLKAEPEAPTEPAIVSGDAEDDEEVTPEPISTHEPQAPEETALRERRSPMGEEPVQVDQQPRQQNRHHHLQPAVILSGTSLRCFRKMVYYASVTLLSLAIALLLLFRVARYLVLAQ
ncbi:unnamed protein product [Notodromas monacha]|uniref:UBC core domain-containing protein n=1 Tax=Notodromas monacha TaxID=399045 RepID=A0A7R9BED6_9CRUS|nr:unnamed protein product [Notodromas monacha]CAG0912916.1 unnamed protein product [Notodromas monacha]